MKINLQGVGDRFRSRPLLSTSRSRLGFSLVEVLIAIGVVATGILALLAVFITGTRSNEHGEDLSRATFYARKVLEIVRSESLAYVAEPTIPPPVGSGLNDNAATWRALDAAPVQFSQIRTRNTNGSLDVRDNKFERNIQMRRAGTSAADYNYNLVIIDVKIRWKSIKSGSGHRQVKVSSIVKQGS